MPKKIKKQYVPFTDNEKLAYLVGECAEVIQAIAKAQRFGLDNFNPELPPSERELNRDWILRELIDLERGISYVRGVVDDGGFERRLRSRARLRKALVK
jgi:hypothetical protein